MNLAGFICSESIFAKALSVILLPFSLGYWFMFEISRSLTKKYRIDNAVAIGNITAGGTGKTPVTLHLSKLFPKTVILARGYGGTFRGIIKKGQPEPDGISDETALYLRDSGAGAVLVGSNRIGNIREFSAVTSESILICDDAMQHFPLIPGATIALLDGKRPFGNRFLIPSGILREPVGALSRADIILVRNIGALRSGERERVLSFGKPVFGFEYIAEGIVGRDGAAAAKPPKALALCGIGNPEGFTGTLEELGIVIAGKCFFPDHHRYGLKDIVKIKTLAKGLPVITTEKDIVKLGNSGIGNLFYLRIRVKIDNEENFLRVLREKLGHHTD